jgi:hypothetical protein
MRLPPNIPVTVMPGEVAVCRLPPDADVASLVAAQPIYSITRTADELSLVCPVESVPDGAAVERGWRVIKVSQLLDFAQVGLLASLLDPLMKERVSVFVISTYNTDYVLVKEEDLKVAITALRVADHRVEVAGEDPARLEPPLKRGTRPGG